MRNSMTQNLLSPASRPSLGLWLFWIMVKQHPEHHRLNRCLTGNME